MQIALLVSLSFTFEEKSLQDFKQLAAVNKHMHFLSACIFGIISPSLTMNRKLNSDTTLLSWQALFKGHMEFCMDCSKITVLHRPQTLCTLWIQAHRLHIMFWSIHFYSQIWNLGLFIDSWLLLSSWLDGRIDLCDSTTMLTKNPLLLHKKLHHKSICYNWLCLPEKGEPLKYLEMSSYIIE